MKYRKFSKRHSLSKPDFLWKFSSEPKGLEWSCCNNQNVTKQKQEYSFLKLEIGRHMIRLAQPISIGTGLKCWHSSSSLLFFQWQSSVPRSDVSGCTSEHMTHTKAGVGRCSSLGLVYILNKRVKKN